MARLSFTVLVVGTLAVVPVRFAGGAEDAAPPNIVLILADDLGYSDIGCYGSEIATPHLDRLAKEGVRFTQFYNTARCCPTRAALLTGLYPHQAGVGHMTEDQNRPGYRGNLHRECVTIAELLRAAGYQTMMCGKWHVTRYTAQAGPKHTWPLQRGFEKFFGTIAGGGSYFNPVTLCRDNEFVAPSGEFYKKDAIAEQAAQYIDQAARAGRPFFLYVAFTAPHWPLHAKPADLARYRGKYASGWDVVRDQRHKRMIQLGVVRPEWPLTPRDERVRPWVEVPHRAWHERRMEVYAAQVDSLDQGVGRILEELRRTGQEHKTLVMFLSDNGACAEEIAAAWRNPVIPDKTLDGRPVQVGNDTNFLPGDADTFQSYGVPWANVSNTPFRLYKHWVHEGGIATPLICRWPSVLRGNGRLTHQVGHVIDLMPTCLEAARVKYPASFGGYRLKPLEGTSLLPILRGETLTRGMLFWEHEGNRAVRDGKWKLVARHRGPWELYDMEADRTEMNDLAAKFPALVTYMAKAYEEWAKRAGVEPWGGR